MNTNIRSNVIANLIRTITITVLSFITFPFICRVLGDQQLGLYTWANTFVYYFLIIAKASVPNIAIRECVKVRDDKNKLSQKAQEFFIIQASMTLLSFIFMLSLIFTVPSLMESKELILILSINFLSGAFSFEWIYIALEKHFYMSIRSIIILAISAILVFSLIKYPEQVYLYAFITCSVTLLTVITNVIMLRKQITFKRIEKYNFKQYFKPLFILFIISFILTLYNESDIFILGLVDTTHAEVGGYSVGVKGIEIIITIITSLSAVFMPRANYYYQKENKYFFNNLTKYSLNICFFIAIPAIATMTTLAKPITTLISGNTDGLSYINASMVLIVLCAMMLTYSIGDIIYTQILIPMKKEKIYLITMAIGVILNISLSIVLALTFFKNNPSIGVAIATAATDLIILLFLIIKTWKYTKHAIFNLNILKIFIFGIIIAVVTYFVSPIIYDILFNQFKNIEQACLLQIILTVIIDAVIYIVGLILTKENLVSSFLKKKGDKENA